MQWNTRLNSVQYSDHHLGTQLQNIEQVYVCSSDDSIIQMSGIQIPSENLKSNISKSGLFDNRILNGPVLKGSG